METHDELRPYKVGELCAFKDSPRGKKYWIGTVSEITAKDIHVEYWGTKAAAGTPLGKVRFQTVFTNRSANKWAWALTALTLREPDEDDSDESED